MSTSAVLNINPSSCKAPSQFPVVFLSIYFARERCVKSLVSWFKIGTDFIAIANCALTSTCVHTQKHKISHIYTASPSHSLSVGVDGPEIKTPIRHMWFSELFSTIPPNQHSSRFTAQRDQRANYTVDAESCAKIVFWGRSPSLMMRIAVWWVYFKRAARDPIKVERAEPITTRHNKNRILRVSSRRRPKLPLVMPVICDPPNHLSAESTRHFLDYSCVRRFRSVDVAPTSAAAPINHKSNDDNTSSTTPKVYKHRSTSRAAAGYIAATPSAPAQGVR